MPVYCHLESSMPLLEASWEGSVSRYLLATVDGRQRINRRQMMADDSEIGEK